MSYLRARQILIKVAGLYQRQKDSYSHREILEKINQIKYMSTQKKVSRLSIRKEIALLENKVSGLAEYDERIARKKQEESVKINSLKRQVEVLKKRLTSSQCPDLQNKVDKLSHLLGDFLAKQVTEEDIALSQQLVEELQKSKPKNKSLESIQIPVVSADIPPDSEKISALHQKLQQLKDEMQFNPLMDPAKKDSLGNKIRIIEEKLSKYAPLQTAQIETISRKEIPSLFEAPTGKHDILFSISKPIVEQTEEDRELDLELPLPPPPRMK